MKSRFPRFGALLLSPVWGLSGLAYSQTVYDWKDTAPDGNWTQGAAGARWWDGSGDFWDIPTTATGAVLRFNNDAQLTMTNNAAGTYELHGLVFGSSAAAARTIGGNAIRFYDFGTVNPYITNDSGATHVINLALNGDGGESLKININGAGGLTFGGTINNQGAWIDVGGSTTSAATVAFNGIISGSGGFYKANANTTAVLGAVNTFTGKTLIEGGIVSIAADSGLGAAPGTAVADQLTVNGGTLRITAAGQTLNANRGITLGASGGTIETSTISGTGITTTIGGVIAGNGALTLKSTGNMSASGGSDGGLGIKLNQATNTFTGDVTITSGLVSYVHNLSFGNAANKIILNGGGLLDPNTNIALSRDIEVQAGGGTFRTYGSVNVTWSGAVTGSGTINRTDGGTLTLSGDLSGFGGTFNCQTGGTSTTNLTGTSATIGGNWSVASGTTLVVNSTAAQTLAGTVSGTGGTLTVTSTGGLTLTGSANLGTGGTFRVNAAGIATLGSGANLNADTIAMTGTASNQLNIGTGANVTTKYFNIGDASGNSGRIVQTGGSVTVATGGTGFRIGHWNNNANAGSSYDISGGTLDTTAVTANIGWDGQGSMAVGGGVGTATFKAGAIQLDANGNGGGSGAGDMTLTLSANGVLESGGNIGGAAAGDRVILDGGTMKAMAGVSWNSVINANTATTSYVNVNGFDATATNNLTGTGTINLSSATGSLIFSTTGTQTVSPALTGSTPVTKSGTGTTTLSGTGSTHSGTISIADGRLNLDGTSTSNLSLSAGKTLGGEGLTTGSATLNGGYLNIDPNSAANLTVGDLSLSGTNNIRFDAIPAVAGGPVNVLTYTGSLSGTIGTDLVVENAAKYRNSTLVDTSGVVTLDIQSKNLVWNGTSGGQWDTRTSARWNAGEADQFAWGDSVTFDDTGVNTNVAITGEVQPSSITVTGTNNYTITGGAGNFISGPTGVAKSGTSTLVLNAPNTFTGATTVTGGTLQVGDGTNNTATLGNNSAASVATGASLVFYRNGAYTVGNVISGAGTLAFRGTGASGQSEYTIGGNNSGFTGTFDIRSGSRVLVDNTADVGTSAIVVNSGGQLWLSGATLTNSVSLAGNGWTEGAGQLGAVRFGGGTLAGTVTLTGNTRLTTWTGDSGTVSGVITDGASSFGLTKTGTGTLTLTNANTYDGGTTLSFGRVNIRNASSLGTGAVTIGDSSSSSNAISLYLDTSRTSFSRAVTVTSNGSGTVTLGSMSSVTGTGDNNQFTSISLQRDVTFDSNAADRTDYENISGTGNITVTGTGRSIFITNNTYVGNLTIRTSTDANGLQLGTVSSAFNALYDTGSVQIDSGGKLTLSFSANGSETIGALNGAGTVRQNGGALNTLIFGNGGGSGTFSGAITNGAGTIAITKVGAGTQTLSGANTQTGATGVSGGTLALDYATQNNTKLSDTAALTFGAGSGTISLSGGSHTEVVASTTLAAGASASIARPSGTSVLQLGTITVGANATLNLSVGGIATTNNTNTGGMLGAWATVGTDWAMNSTNAANGPITAYTGYVNYTRLSSGTKAIANSAADNARIQEGTGTAANLTLAAATTNINTLNQTATGGATTIDMGANTLRLGTSGGILAGPGVSALTIGSSVNQGFLSAGGSTTNTAGTLYVTNNSSNTVTINSPLVNNGTGAVTLVKVGSAAVYLAGYTGAAYSGGTLINQGELSVVTPNTAGTYTTLGTGSVTVNTGATLRFTTGSHANALTFANAINLNNATLINNDGSHILTGAVALTGANTINGVWSGKNLTLSGVVSGAGSLTKTGSASLILSNTNTYTGGTTVTGGILTLGTGGANGAIRGTVTVNSGTTLNHTANNTFGYNAGASVNVLNIVGGTVGNAGYGNHFWNSFQLNMTAGTLNLGYNASQTTNEWHSPTITTNASSSTATIAAADAAAVMRLRDGTHATFNVADGSAAIDLSVTAAITQSGGTSNITKNGAGLMQISGVNTFSGTTTIGGGTLRVSGSGSLNSGNYAANITNNGVLEFTSTATQTLGGIISGSGSITKSTGTGTLTLSGNNTYTGVTTIGSGRFTLTGTNASSITINSGATLTGSGSTTGGLITNAGSTIALNGITPAAGFSSSGAVSFAGTTTIAFAATPTVLGVNQHLVSGYGSVSGIGNLVAPSGYRASIINDTLNSKVLLETTTGTRTWNRSDAGGWDILTNTSWAEGDDMFANGDAVVFDDTATNGSVNLAGTLNPSAVTFNNSSTAYSLSGSGAIAGSAVLTKSGVGAVSITTNNTYTGATAVNVGALNIQHANALGSTVAGTTVASGAALEIQGGITTAEGLTIAGTGVSNGGAIRNISGTNTISGGISLTAASTVTSVAGGLTLSGTVTSASGTQTLTIGGGSVTMSGANNTVDITVNNGGTLYARGGGWATSFAAGRTITVNTGGTLDTVTHSLNGLGGGSRPANIVINEDGIWKLNNEQQLPSTALTLTAGIVNGPGEVRGGGTIASAAHATKSSVINAPLSTGNGAITFNVADGAVDTDLSVTGNIGGSNGITKNTGTGTLVFSGNNSYTAATNINAGAMRASSNTALGTTAAGTTVASGAALQLAANVTIGAEALSLSGTGVANDGALRNISGTNTFGGAITLAAAARVNSDADTMILTGNVANGASLLTVGGAGNMVVSGVIGGGSGGLTKDGTGGLALSGANTYSGGTTVSGGSLIVNNTTGSGTGSGAVNVTSGTLGGSGTISGAVSIGSGATLAPGNSPGTLTINNDLGLNDTSILAFELNPLDTTVGSNINDLVTGIGNLTLNGVLNVSATSGSFSGVTSGSWRLFDYTGTLTDGGLSFGSMPVLDSGYSWELDTLTANQVNLKLIPEPASALLLGLGSLGLLLRRRRD